MDKIFSDRTINATDCIAPVSSMALPSQRPLQLKDFYGVLLLFTFGGTAKGNKILKKGPLDLQYP
ncbi:hypothetical protein E2C01_046591 [Portunus trituberculatus]|uniref:Uncharacterized protein n=1 Tax=Portunus trituberculatus TaxID=210409 RepID=A0A5B7G5H5_PORTR|nr:hypothetical protein [Portunus trituberculatus]